MISKFLKILGLQPRISKDFSRSLEQFFLTVGQNDFGNKTPLHTHVYKRTKGFKVGLMILRTFGGHEVTNNFVFRAKFKCFLAADFILFSVCNRFVGCRAIIVVC